MALWGDSHAAANFFSEEFLAAVGLAGDKVLPSFIPATLARPGVRLPLRKHCLSNGWSYGLAHLANRSDNAYYKSLATLKTDRPGSYLWLDLRNKAGHALVRNVDLFFYPPPPGSKSLIGITVDDGPEHILTISTGLRGIVKVRGNRAFATLKFRLIEGTLAFEGLAPDYVAKPRLYFDTLAIPGATGRGWRQLDTDYFKDRAGADSAKYDYDVVILEYGTNEGNERNFDAANYQTDLRQELTNLRRIYPRAACYLLGPTDRGVAETAGDYSANPSGEMLKYARVHQKISDIQAAVAPEFGCHFWNWQQAMGGAGGAYRWYWNDPPLMAKDLTHLTVAGYRLSARLFAASLNWPADLP